ncbi:abortive infection bacteriophage resistance protein [Xylanibacter oryzae DSM 17970]|uniref:Abortive infection bacteriophage resistance protein n=1 Tax=Xylanibacter oryzae DSM 17970 TaxID=915438 RepID=A0ABP3BCP0_9BACT|nr:Abi family protein [Xylanibacter oryzae]EXG77847.1 abortive infection bacteriophage resistance protein [Xylanibacter oryzae DSM 17970]
MSEDLIKQATTVDEQIEKLKSRGMTIEDEEKAKENLMDIGYFRLGFYAFPFEKTYPRITKRNHEYAKESKFEYIIQLYYFDFDLRNIFLRYISRIEINLRTTLIYLASNKYKDDPFWYVNSKVVKSSFIHNDKYKQAIADTKKERVVKEDLKNHDNREYAPAWKVIEFFSFGIIIKLYENLIDWNLKVNIAQVYGTSPSQFLDYINVIRQLRNYSAHGKVLFDMNFPKPIGNGPAGEMGARKSMLSGAYMVFKYFLGRVSSNRVDEMIELLKAAFNKVSCKCVKEKIESNSGFRLNDL